MAEEERKHRSDGGHPGLRRDVGVVLRWIWVGVLSILLVAGLVFQAPWKVLAMPAIFILACTALPRRRRKWSWAAFGLALLALTIWVFLPDDSQGWRSYVFEDQTEMFLEKYRVPDSENAALLYEHLRQRWEADDPHEPPVPTDWYEKTKQGPWRSEDHPEIARWLDHHEATLKRLLEATGREHCFFEEDARNVRTPLTPKVQPLAATRQWAFLLEAAANRDLAERHPKAALEKQLAALRLATHLRKQPIQLHAIVGQGIASMALGQINKTIVAGDIDPQYLAAVDEALAAIRADWSRMFEGILESDKLHTKNMLAAMIYQTNDAGQVRYVRNPWAPRRNQIQDWLESGEVEDEATRRYFQRAADPGYWRRRAHKAKAVIKWFVFPSNPERMSKVVDKAYERYIPMLDPAFEKQIQPPSWLSVMKGSVSRRYEWDLRSHVECLTAMEAEGHHKFHSAFRRVDTMKQGTQVVLALRRYKNAHGEWPKDLQNAKDYGDKTAFTDACGRPLIYNLTGNSFVLYSKGENGLNEGGQYKVEYSEDYATATLVKDDWMIYTSQER